MILSHRLKRGRQDEDYIRFQLEQLEEAGLKDGEQTELEQEAETLSHAEDIKAGLYKASQLINGEGRGYGFTDQGVHADSSGPDTGICAG